MPGTGGLPPRRVDQMRTPSPPSVAPGGAAGITRARIVEVIGGTNSGIFVYSGQPGAGDLIASLVGNTTSDIFGNAVIADSLTFYGASGNKIVIGLEGAATFIEFATGASFENTPANIASGVQGSGSAANMQLNISGPQGNNPDDDWVQVEMISGSPGGGNAVGFLNYITTGGLAEGLLSWGASGVDIFTGTVNGITPGTGSLTFPGATAGAVPTGTATQASSCAAGSPLLSYLTAFASTYNTTVAAVTALVSLLINWGV
jgi:hypothetical protein